MRFLVTRPQPDCRRTADRLRRAGHQADEVPLLEEIVTVPDMFNLDAVTALAVTSSRVGRLLAGHHQEQELHGLPVYTVGERTAEAMRAAGFRTVLSADGDTAALAALISADCAQGLILYPAAHDRSGDLEGLLERAGIRCQPVELYKMAMASAVADGIVQNLADDAYDAILIYSRRTAQAFRNLAGDGGFDTIAARQTFVVISSQAAGPLWPDASVKIPSNPREVDMLELALSAC